MNTSKKSILIGFLLLVATTFTQAQVGVGTSSPHASAKLEVSSTTQGFLPPRMTTAQRTAITNPATGLIIFNTTTNALNVYFSGAWYQFSTNAATGSIASLVTESPTNNGSLTSGTAASGVSSVVSYTGGNGENHSGQTVTSTSVTGLTATLSAGTFAVGAGTLTYNITGTPASDGTASFALNIGGQTGTLTRNVVASTPTIVIGTQQWMQMNLDVTTYSNGDQIPKVTDPSALASLTTGAWCWYNNDAANGAIYGKLYNWYAVVDSRGLCPTGWHVPTDAEWTTMETTLGGSSVAGGKMKSTGTTRWNSPNNATNESGFSALPGGFINSDGFSFFGVPGSYNVNNAGYWWSSTESDDNYAYIRYLVNSVVSSNRSSFIKKDGLSVRCIKD